MSLAEAEQTQRDRPRLERERHSTTRRVERDLGTRRSRLAADPPCYIVEALGPRPEGGAVASLWDNTAARTDQDRSAFDIKYGTMLGSLNRPWDDSALAVSLRAASNACDRCQRHVNTDPLSAPEN